MIPLNEEQHLGRRAFYLMWARNVVFALLFFLIAIGLIIVLPIIVKFQIADPVVISYFISGFWVAGFLLFVIGTIQAILRYHFYTFTLEEFGLKMNRGILHQKEISIPYRQIQDVNIDRPLIYRFFGLSTLVMLTAAHEEANEKEMAEVVLEPVNRDIAEELSGMLKRKIGVQIVEDEAVADLRSQSDRTGL